MAQSTAQCWTATIVLALAASQSLDAATIDNPTVGGHSGFFWEMEGALAFIEDLGPDDGVSGEAGTTDWLLVLAAPGFIDISVGNVYNRPPTQFDLVIDGVVVPWTHWMITPLPIAFDDEGNPIEWVHYFDGTLVEHLLDFGAHMLTLVPSLSNTDGNTGTVTFGGVRAVPVSAPAAGLYMLVAVVGVVTWLRRHAATRK